MFFDNCTIPWFGPNCRFTFDSITEKSFNEFVTIYFHSKPQIKTGAKITCYKYLPTCETSLLCLDWREICDRKIDCLDGSDEFHCWQLELNECTDNEYRCHNGQCIPIEFFHDISLNPDCLDRTDEPRVAYYPDLCHRDPTFRCEEHTCRPGIDEFPCGDGQCSTKFDLTCQNGRDNNLVNNSCSNAAHCRIEFYNSYDNMWCQEFCSEIDCVEEYCSPLLNFSTLSLFRHVQLLFNSSQFTIEPHHISLPIYVCYDEKLCRDFLPATIDLNSSSCRYFHELEFNKVNTFFSLLENINNLFRTCLIVLNETHYCNHSNMYQCKNSTKCISKYRLLDRIQDCPLNDDETFTENCSLPDVGRRFSCSIESYRTCLAPLIIKNGKIDCDNGEDERGHEEKLIEKHIYFQTICDGKIDLLPVLIDGQYQTDETECDSWLCNNTYSRCDRFWLCKNGADEINCPSSNCSEYEHSCVFPNDTSKVSCLPIHQVDDNIIHCIGATDERYLNIYDDVCSFQYLFKCWNDSKFIKADEFCDRNTQCPFGDDETFCTPHRNFTRLICYGLESFLRNKVESFFCYNFEIVKRSNATYFKLVSMPIYSKQSITDRVSSEPSMQTTTQSVRTDPLVSLSLVDKWQCNRGLPIRIRMDDIDNKTYCFCPPSYYGNLCQYQNQRVSLTIQVRATSDWRQVFSFIIILIDDNEIIQSHDHIEYLPIRDCDTKFNVYLLYSTRPKNISKNYFIRIHAYNKLSLKYRASWIFPLEFSFLPVHRLSVLLIVPILDVEPIQTCTQSCIHGQCYNYINDQNSKFCRCNSGWSGVQCNIEYKCDCANNSLCIDRSICVCPLGRFGSRCYLYQSSCQLKPCINNGQCVPSDERYISTQINKSMCICSEEYFGNQCEHQQTRIDISFHNELISPSSLLVHFITVSNQAHPIRSSIMKKISWDQHTVTLYTLIQFHIAFAEIFNNYYLIILREQIIVSAVISTQIMPSHRCLSIHELFNKTLVNQHLLRRIKYYHIPCQTQLDLVCFYDDIHLCLCDVFRRSNCFEFDHNMTYDCRGYNLCENGGHCFSDVPKCPTSTVCVCQDCYYGSRCQFSTKGSILSLDTIFGYQIRPNVNISRQPYVVKIVLAATVFIFILGIINSLLSFLTFQRKNSRTVGCGIYLFVSSITSIIMLCILIFKVWLLLMLQIGSIKNRMFMYIQCMCIDFLLRCLLSINDWLCAWIAVERAVNIFQGIHFNKVKSKQNAKWIIWITFLFNIISHIHDPMHRYLVDDLDEQRTWCMTKFSSLLQMYDWYMNIFHFSIPFSINFISTIIIIIFSTRIRSATQQKHTYIQLLREQIQQYKHLIISPSILVLIGVPRLIISFLFGCMKTARNSWFYLIGYLISFIPTMLTFFLFVLPSEIYKKELINSIKHFWS
ncbi:unnamed protein product [Rotaria sp. Silwood1]|nr:unnamed protein product [Rotaria sp. Silwood1]CAF3451630.1 unnamed protein product [Rotaria sp. Silwood1]CAF3510764.1 unnamed protein product [Rotaria sp. Silwood1]CAF4580000.1 unnamed protein product [Rotaria sp. Silwood1]CAF4649695.1 unnamed protein product [Rotaria sp. Silwood1]